MGGFFGAVSRRDVVLDVFFGVDYHSHLGTRRAGMIVRDHTDGFQRQIHSIENTPFRTKFEDDIVRFHRALGYVGARDCTAYVRFGMTEEAFVRSLPAALAAAVHGDCCDTEVVSAYITVPPRVVKVGGYERLYADLQHIWHELLPDERPFSVVCQVLRVIPRRGFKYEYGCTLECGGPVIRIEAAELLSQQLRRAGLAPDAGFDAMEAAAEQLLLYESERLTIGFAAWSLDREEERPVLDGVEVSFVLVR